MSSSAIGNAIVAALGSDSALLADCVHGVYMAGEVPSGSTRFVTVALVTGFDGSLFGGRASETHTYDVTAHIFFREREAPAGNIAAAAARIDAVLEGQPIAVSGFTWADSERLEFVREVDRDADDVAIGYRIRGGRYQFTYWLETVGAV